MNAFEKKRGEIEFARIQLGRLQRDLQEMEAACPHNHDPSNWKVEYTPERIEGYHCPGDPPGTMGVDRQLPFDVPAKTIEKWTRKCKLCGKTEVTQQTRDVVTPVKKEPRW